MARTRHGNNRARGPAKESWLLPLGLLVLFGVGWIEGQPAWLRVVVIVPATIAFGVWWVLFYAETECNAPTPTSARFDRCTNRVRGRLSACGISGHRRLKRQELMAALLRRPPPQPPASRSARRRQPGLRETPAATEQSPSWLLDEASYRAWTLGISAAGCLATVISTAAAIYAVANS